MLEVKELLLGHVNNGGRGKDNSGAWLYNAQQTWTAMKWEGQNGPGGVFHPFMDVAIPGRYSAMLVDGGRARSEPAPFLRSRCPDILQLLDTLLGAPLSLGKISRFWPLSAEPNGTMQRCHP